MARKVKFVPIAAEPDTVPVYRIPAEGVEYLMVSTILDSAAGLRQRTECGRWINHASLLMSDGAVIVWYKSVAKGGA